jgi:hypothetical protein
VQVGSGARAEIEASYCGIRSTSACRQNLAVKVIRAATRSEERSLLARRVRAATPMKEVVQ